MEDKIDKILETVNYIWAMLIITSLMFGFFGLCKMNGWLGL